MARIPETTARPLLGCTAFVTVLAVWWTVVKLGRVPAQFLPSPDDILRAGGSLVQKSDFWLDFAMSVLRVVGSVVLSGIVAIPVGTAMAANATVRYFCDPLVNFIRYLPLPGFIPLTILWFGIDETQKIVVLFIGTFFQLLPMVVNAARAIDFRLVDIAKNFGASGFEQARHVILPAAGPEIYEALRVSSGIAWTYLTVAEIVAAPNGLGHLIVLSQRYLQTANIFVAILTIGILGVLTDGLFYLCKPAFFPHLRFRAGLRAA